MPAAALTSPEPKARQTLEEIVRGRPVGAETNRDLEEHRRSSWGYLNTQDFERRMARVFQDTGSSCCGAEPADAALMRFNHVLSAEQRRPLLVCSHGTIMSLFLAQSMSQSAEDLWRSLQFADGFVMDANLNLLARFGVSDI